jgi:hypothetical protein
MWFTYVGFSASPAGAAVQDASILNTSDIDLCYSEKDNGNLEVEVFNSGSDTITSLNLGWYFTDLQFGSSAWNGVIEPNTSALISLTNVIFPDTGDFALTVWADMGSADGNSSNDTLVINVHVFPKFELDVLNDTSICENTSFQVSLPMGSNSYSWLGGGNALTKTIGNSGDYIVQATDVNGCQSVDTMSVSNYLVPALILPGDTVLCSGDIFVPVLDPSFISYSWGGIDGNLIISQEGIYDVTVLDTFGCTHSDTMSVSYLAAPNPLPTPQVKICQGDSALLQAAVSFQSYLWSTGDTTRSIETPYPGFYQVTVTGNKGCLGFDTVQVIVDTIAELNFSDSLMCNLEPILLNAGIFSSYEWSNGEITAHAVIVNPGMHYVTVTNSIGCKSTDSVEVINQNVKINLGPDRENCKGQGDYFYILGLYDSYLWNNGDTGMSNWIGAEGMYSVTVTLNGCHSTDEIFVTELSYPHALFNEDITSPNVNFTNMSNVITGLVWDFGDGQTSSSINPDHQYANSGIYDVTLTASNKCDTSVYSKQVGIFPQAASNIYVNENLNVFPTLATNYINFTLDGVNLDEIEYTIYDAVGKLVYSKSVDYFGKNHVYSVSVSNFASGSYFLRLVGGIDAVSIKPFIVE